MKKLFHRITALLLCLLLCLPCAARAEDLAAAVAADSAVLRSGPGDNTDPVKLNGSGPDVVLHRGDEVSALDMEFTGDNGEIWYLVFYYVGLDCQVGYLRADQLRFAGSGDPAVQDPGSASFTLTGDSTAETGGELRVTVKLHSVTAMGAWLFELRYDGHLLSYVSGADSAKPGRLLFCNVSDGVNTVTFDLVFTAVNAGQSALTVSSPQVLSAQGAELTVADLSYPVEVQGRHDHVWSETEYLWSADFSVCTASHSCTVCGMTEEDNASSAFEHHPASCITPGSTVYTATFFDDLFEPVTLTVETSPALGHAYAAEVIPPGCTENGRIIYTCARCGDVSVGDGEEASGHDYIASVVAPSCTAPGCTVYTCSRCGDSYVTDETPVLDHAFGEAVYVWSEDLLSCTASRVCTVCGASESETAPAELAGNRRVAAFENPAFETRSTAAFLWGDANGDGKVSNLDVVRLKNYLANYDEDTGVSSLGDTVYSIAPGADANGDGKVSNLDVVRLKNYLANYDEDTGLSSVILGPAVS